MDIIESVGQVFEEVVEPLRPVVSRDTQIAAVRGHPVSRSVSREVSRFAGAGRRP